MKLITKTVLVAGMAALVATPAFAAPHGRGGTDILHLSIKEAFTNDNVEPSAAGTVQLSQNQQGNANNQTMDISATGLTPGTNYTLVAVTTSNTTPTPVDTNLNTDANGNFVVHYRSLGNGKGGGKKNTPLPDGLNPVSQVVELDIENAGGQPVLTADLRNPSSVVFLDKKNLTDNTGGGATGVLQIKGNQNSTKFKLNAKGLTPSTDYALAFNGGVVQTNTADAKGNLKINSAPTPSNILDLQTVDLLDPSSANVFHADLP